MHMEGFSSAPYLKEGDTQRNSGHDEDVLLHPHFNALLAALDGGEKEKGGGGGGRGAQHHAALGAERGCPQGGVGDLTST